MPIRSFDRKAVPLYSDLLLHDVGTGDGIEQADAKGRRFGHALWGLRFRSPLLHDGTSATIESATERHGGEASSVIERFKMLNSEARKELLAFLRSL